MNHREIAIVGMACRLPGGIDSPDLLVDALRRRRVTADDVPPDRWDARRYYAADEHAKGKAYVCKGNFLRQDVRAMDAEFFELPPRMAENLDPQQRLLLELAWEAFENAGLDLPAHAGAKVGVYVGGFMLDHMITLTQQSNRAKNNANTAAGMMMTMLSNRLSHAFDLRGPSLSIDTACSSSLVAFSVACRDIWAGDCDMALVGGVNVMMRPEYPIGMSKGHFLSRDGQCKSFDARGDGYGRGEGGGIVLLKALERARADGDTILATVAGAGVNSDGFTPGISMPSAAAQSQLIQDVCERFAIDPREVRYVECHGTGTAVGDPIEAASIGARYGRGRRGDARVVLGSIKSNIGHLEAAAGVAGVIKAVLTLQHRTAFALGNFETPHPGIPFDALGVRVADQALPLARADESFLVAVNSFGYGGTNAHVVLRSAPAPAPAAPAAAAAGRPAGFPLYLPLSTRSPAALAALALDYDARLAELEAAAVAAPDAAALTDLLHSAAHRRAHLSHRAVVVGADLAELRTGLAALAAGEASGQAVTGRRAPQRHDLPVWVFTGMGPQWWAMGQQLYRDEPVYRAAVEAADAQFARIAGFSILAEMLKPEADSRITETALAQPANFVVQWGIAKVLEAAGVRPGAIVGHSVGEVTAACVAGALSLEDALRVSYHRSRLHATTAGSGSMLAVGLSREAVAPWLAPYAGRVEVAAVNGPATLTLAGETAAIEALAIALKQHEVFNRVLQVEVPYHSHLMDPILPALREALAGIEPRRPHTPLYSTVSGAAAHALPFDAAYWARNVREPVAFMPAVLALLEDGYTTFVELGPHPVLSAALRDCAKLRAKPIALVETLRRGEPEVARLHRAVAQVFAHGATIDWTPLNGEGRLSALPNYPWQRERLWVESERSAYQRVNASEFPLLGCAQYPVADAWANDLEHEALAYLKDHVVGGVALMPAAAYLETALEAAASLYPDAAGWRLAEVTIHAPLVIAPERAIEFVTSHQPDTRGLRIHSVESGRLGAGPLHLSAQLAALPAAAGARVDLDALRAGAGETRDVTAFYAGLARLGLRYGPGFRCVRGLQVARDGTAALARVEAGAGLPLAGYYAQPALLDACLQVLVSLTDADATTYLPTGLGELCLLAPLPARFWCEARRGRVAAGRVEADLTLVDDAGEVLATLRGLVLSAAPARPQRVDAHGDPVKLQLMRYQWSEAGTLAEPARLGHWLVVEDARTPEAAAIAEQVCAGIEVFGGRVGRRVDAAALADLDALLEGAVDGVVFAHGLDARLGEPRDPTGVAALQRMQALTRRLAARPEAQRPRAYLVTSGAHAVLAGDRVEPAQTALNGYARVAFNEVAGLRFSSVDLPAAAGQDDVDALILELLCDAGEDEVALRGGRRYSSRLAHGDALAEPLVEALPLAPQRRVKVRPLAANEAGAGSVKLIEAAAAPLGDAEVEIRVEQLGLSMRALRAASDEMLGDARHVEIVGCVVAVGAAVHDLRVGTRVYGLAPAEVASHLRGPRAAFHLAPLDVAGAAAAAPDALLHVAARHAVAARLAELAAPDGAAGFGPDARALVSADATGRLVARYLAERGLQVSLLADFAAPLGDAAAIAADPQTVEVAVAALTRGRGFDVLVGDLAAWSERLGWRALADGGALVDTAATARPLVMPGGAATVARADIAVLAQRAAPFAAALGAAVARAARGELGTANTLGASLADLATLKLALPEADLPLNLAFDDADLPLPVRVADAPRFDPAAAYLVTGGFGGFGRKTAEWLLAGGARHLVLVGRGGADAPERRAFVAALEGRGASVTALACDCADAAQMDALFARIAALPVPLRGVFHAAALIQDAPIAELDAALLGAVFAAKAESARLLHEHTRDLALDHFVLYSSIANLVGNSRQAAYSSANGFLDGLAWHRRSLGLPATSVNWGAIADVGVVTRDERLEQFMRYMGLRGMASGEALAWLGRALRRAETQLGITLITSWADWGRYETQAGASPRYAALIAADQQGAAGAAERLRDALAALAPAGRFAALAARIAALFADALQTSAEAIGVDAPILDLGVDSLLATELQLQLDRELGIGVSVLEILGDLSIRAIVDKTLADLGLGDATPAPAAAAMQPADPPLARAAANDRRQELSA